MRRPARWVRGLLGFGVIAAVTVAATSSAFGATVVEPMARPFTVPPSTSGAPASFTIRVAGFTPGRPVFVEQCDGNAPTIANWDPTLNCDLGSSPAPVTADSHGDVTFSATDGNHAFHPFRGAGPQALFNCLAPGDRSPANGTADFQNCQVRVSSNNATVTTDQVFFAIRLSSGGIADASVSAAPAAVAAAGTKAGAAVPTAEPAAAGGGVPGALARTGSEAGPLATIATLLLLAGTPLVATGGQARTRGLVGAWGDVDAARG